MAHVGTSEGTDDRAPREEVEHWRAGLEGLHGRIAARFRLSEVREWVRRSLATLLAPVERKNGWQLAEAVGAAGPRGVQRLLSGAHWDAEAVRDDLRAYVVAHLGTPDGVLVIDETGFLKKGIKSVGVASQYRGTAGKVEPCPVGVFLASASVRGRAFLDRALYLPKEWAADARRRAEAGGHPRCASRPRASWPRPCARAFAAGVPAAGVRGDKV